MLYRRTAFAKILLASTLLLRLLTTSIAFTDGLLVAATNSMFVAEVVGAQPQSSIWTSTEHPDHATP